MAKFCNKCGRPLQEGEVCQCQTNPASQPQAEPQFHNQTQFQSQPMHNQQPQAQYQQPQAQYQQPQAQYQQPNYSQVAPQKPNGFVIYLKALLDCLKAYFNDSSKTLELSASSNDIKTGLSFAGLNCIFAALFFTALIGNNISKISSYININIGGLCFQVFIAALLLSAAAFFGICAVGIIIGAMTGKKAAFTAFMASVGTALALPAVVMILATIFALFWLQGASALVAIALFTLVINTYSAIKITLGISDSKISVYYGLFIAVVFIILYFIASQILMQTSNNYLSSYYLH